MSKLQKISQTVQSLPKSDWEKEMWNAEDYKRHQKDFETILGEYRNITDFCYSAIMARWYWLELKGAVKLRWFENHLGEGYIEPFVRRTYTYYSNMFSKFNEWLSFGEKIESQRTGMPIKTIQDVANSIDKVKLNQSHSEPIDFSNLQTLRLSSDKNIDAEFEDFTKKE